MRRLGLLLAIVAVAVLGGSSKLIGGPDGDPPARSHGRVVRVVDGDTLSVRVNGRTERVRLIGIDTPESVKPGTAPECASKAAAASMRRLAQSASGRGRAVTLVSDPTQDRRDRYGRLLAYVQRRDGTDLGRAQVRRGWADVYVFGDSPFERLHAYRAAERRAADERLGAHRRCGGDFHTAQ